MATTTPNFGWSVPTSTDLVKDGATAIETLGDSIDASLLDLKGGTSGQVLAKNSNTDMDFIWVAQDDSNAIQNAIVDAKGDLIAATAADTPARLAVGANGTILTADSAEATGMKWAAAAAGAGSTLIETQTFSAVSAVNFTSKISSTYDNYFMIFDVSASAASNEDLYIRLRSGSTDNSNSTYNRQLLIASVSTVSTARATSQNALTGCIINNSGRSVGELYVLAPNLAQTTSFTITNNNPDATVASRYINGNFAANTTFDGISFIPVSGTITGKISLYGLAK